MALAQVAQVGDARPRVVRCDFKPCDTGSVSKTLSRLASDWGLKRVRSTTVLAPSEYKLLLTEVPDVPSDELKAAVRWRVKDLIDFHINDAVLDVFALPGTNLAGQSRPMYVVAARRDAIQRRVDLFETAGINLDVIDIPELAQRNLAALAQRDNESLAFLSLNQTAGIVTITRAGELYLSRNIDGGVDAVAGADTERYFDYVALEIQRSMDYYDSHFRQAPVSRILLAPAAADQTGLADYLTNHLNAGAQVMEFARALDWSGQVPAELQQQCALAVAAALRREAVAL